MRRRPSAPRMDRRPTDRPDQDDGAAGGLRGVGCRHDAVGGLRGFDQRGRRGEEEFLSAGMHVRAAGARAGLPGEVMNVVLKEGPAPGTLKVSWKGQRGCRAYRNPNVPEPISDSQWMYGGIPTKRSTTLEGLTSGTKCGCGCGGLARRGPGPGATRRPRWCRRDTDFTDSHGGDSSRVNP